MKEIAAAICTIPFGFIALSLGKVISSYYEGLSRNPNARESMGNIILTIVFVETIAIFTLLVIFMILLS